MLRKRWIALAGMSVAATSIVAWAATSYQVQTKLVNAGGTLKLREKAVQTASLAFNNFTTSAAVPITVTAKEGYSIASITQTGQPTVYNPASPWNGSFLKSRGTIQALGATFAVNKYTVSTSTTGDGYITPSPVPAISYNGNVTLTATPKFTNSAITGYTVSGSNYTTTPLDGGKLAITLTGVKANSSVAVSFGTVSVSAGSNKVVAVNIPTTIRGTATGSGTLAWTVTSKPTGATAVLTPGTDPAKPTFTADTVGKYTLTVTDSVDGRVLSTSSVQVDVVSSVTDAMRANCNGCHNPISGGVPSTAFSSWSTSVHKADGINCVSCHTDGAMPTPVNTASVDKDTFKIKAASAGTVGSVYCAKCHRDSATTTHISTHTAAQNNCSACHASVHNPAVALADEFVGSQKCGVCHSDKYETFVKSGHNFKMNKVENGVAPTFPFSNISGALRRMPATSTDNPNGKPTSWSQTPYVVGGYYWKARWFDKDGYLVTSGTQGVQYNLANGSWSTYAKGSYSPGKPYDCGECHVTGWKYLPNGGGQDGLVGMRGTWVQPGIQCESCHGAGIDHAFAPSKSNIAKVAPARTLAQVRNEEGYGLAVSCGECHTRDGERNAYLSEGSVNFKSAYAIWSNQTSASNYKIGGRIVASGGLGKHHQSYDELFGVDPTAADDARKVGLGKHLKAGVTCGACHDPHKTTVNQGKSGDGKGQDVGCTNCHEVTFTAGAHGGLITDADCLKCHMPKLAKSAINTPSNLAGKALGDVKSHIFKIDLSKADTQTVTIAGGTNTQFMYPWVTLSYACGSCHATPATQLATLNSSYGGKVHGRIIYTHNNGTGYTITPTAQGSTCATACHNGPSGSPVLADDFVGSQKCASCHNDKYQTFVKSGHNFKMNKVENGVAPSFPFSNISAALRNMPATSTDNPLGKPSSWSQTPYVVGGYGWKARWFDAQGYLVTSGAQGVQYNLAYPTNNQVLNQGWSTYGKGSYSPGKPYDCGECHTTGWKYLAGGYGQDGLVGMRGTWVQGGVQCEGCHGAGKNHAKNGNIAEITKVATGRTLDEVRVEEGYGLAVSCRECHTRDGERNSYNSEGSVNFRSAFNIASGNDAQIGGRIVAAGGIGKHHQAGDELLGVLPAAYDMGAGYGGTVAANTIVGKHLPAGVRCDTCHNPHKTTIYQNVSGDGPGMDKPCTDCHAVKANFAVAAHTGIACTVCHMPKMAKSAVNTPNNLAGKTMGDMKTHVMKIRLDLAAQTATVAGGTNTTFMMPWITKEYACGSCHGTTATANGATHTLPQVITTLGNGTIH